MWLLVLALTALMPVSFCNTTAVWDLPAPSNVFIDSYNMKHVLKWDPVQVPNTRIPVKYRVECELVSSTHLMCENITEARCGFTDKIKGFWRGTYKVRAELGERRSDWARAINGDFQAYRDTKIGPVQSLDAKTHANTIIVDFSPPFSPVPDLLRINYGLYYWKEGSEDKIEEVPLKVRTHYVLEDLEDQTVYCVRVKAYTERIEGLMSDPICARTMNRDYTQKEVAVIISCFVIIGIICSVAGYLIYKKRDVLKRVLYPPFRMPYHIEEFLENPPDQPHEQAIDPGLKEEHYDGISIIESTLLVEVNQECADPNMMSAEKT